MSGAGRLDGRLLYRDGLMLVIDKPAGLAVHKGPKGGETLEDHLHELRFGLPGDPHLAHRLDRDTSGCLVLGRHRKALRRLGKLFEHGQVRKTYIAIVEGRPDPPAGLIDQPLLKRSTQKRGWWMCVDPEGKSARTRYRTLDSREGRSLVLLEPLTGRTHQLRVHMDHIGCTMVGDPYYGERNAGEPHLLLHALSIIVPLHDGKPPVEATAPIPAHWPRSWCEAVAAASDTGRSRPVT
ncbi:MAG: RNA pseudouridine synthase [Geminicoccaceae bacterium]